MRQAKSSGEKKESIKMQASKAVSELYVEEIKKKLKENGAAVMVGAGFSRNAERIDKSAVHIPVWFDLADIFCEKLGISEDKFQKKFLDPINLAQQVEELYGKTYLNELLRDVIEDDNYRPGIEHKLLVEIPWTDIFTTNYDTLLERAYNSSLKRHYRVVYRQNDLIHSAGEPRIVKLHGSFPSYEPFIISEEDYRRYPVDYAPFVNTVQQALLENLFVLIGFSGSDPNFLKWIGWIHDNLGLKNAPRIYMVVHKPPSQVQIKMLNARNIDLIILNDIEIYRHDEYKESIKRFLGDLADSCTNDREGRSRKIWPEYIFKSFNKSSSETLNDLKHIHNSYPGWITARVQTLEMAGHLLAEAELCISRIAKSTSIDPLELDICKEYCWLCEITGSRYSIRVLRDLDTIVSRHQNDVICEESKGFRANDEPVVTDTESDGQERLISIECPDDEGESICYIEVCMLHGCRVLGIKQWGELHERILARINKPDMWDDIYTFFCYEVAMNSLYSLEWEELEKKIRLIPADNDHPEWLLRKASLLALIECYEEALEMLKGSIEDLRTILSRLDGEKGNEYNRFSSLESSMISLYSFILQAHELKTEKRLRKNDFSSEEQERDLLDKRFLEDDITNYRDDFIFNLENNNFISRLARNYKPRISVTQKTSFDIGTIYNNIRLGGDNEAAFAFQFISFREATGHPFHIGFVVEKEGLSGALSRIVWISLKYALALITLNPDTKMIDSILTRLLISGIAVQEIDDCCLRLIQLMRYGMKSISERKRTSVFDTHIQESALAVIPELLSRLCTRSSDSIKEQMIELLVEIYLCDALDHGIKVSNLTKRLIECSSEELLKKKLDCFWKISIKQMDSILNDNFRDPFNYLYYRLYSEDEKLMMNKEQEEKYNEMLNKCGESLYSKNAISRLCYINHLYTVPDDLITRFNDIVWNDDNLDEGLPDLGDFNNVLAIDIPCEKTIGEVKDLFEKNLINEYIGIIQSKTIASYNNLFNRTLSLFERIEIDKKKAEKIVSVGLDFCKLLSENKKTSFSFGITDVKNDLFRVDEILGIALLKSGLAGKDKSAKMEKVDDIISILQDNECPHPLLSWCVSEEKRYSEIMRCAFAVEDGYSYCANRAMNQLIEHGIEVEDRIVSMMVDSVSTTMSYTVDAYAFGLSNLVRKNLLEEKYCDQVADALPRFDKITELDILDEDDEVMRKIAMRKAVSILAHTLYNWYYAKNKVIPEGIQFWEDKSNDSNEFAEIRMVWM